MNKIFYKTIDLIFVLSPILILFSACSATQFGENYKTEEIVIQVLKPANIEVPEGIHKYGIVNIMVKDNNKPLSISKSDKEVLHENARKSCLNGLYKHINESEGNNKAIVLTSIESLNPDSINWAQIQAICDENNIDALIYLQRLKINNKLMPNSSNNEKYADLELKTTWIVLFPSIKNRIEKDINYKKLASMNNDKEKFIYDGSENCGVKFGKQIIPGWVNTKREYFSSNNAEFKQATDYVIDDNWDDAAKIWESFLVSENNKLAGKAHYNLALYNELQGNLDKAFELAKKSDQVYKTPLSHEYAGILYKRIQEQYKLAEQIQK